MKIQHAALKKKSTVQYIFTLVNGYFTVYRTIKKERGKKCEEVIDSCQAPFRILYTYYRKTACILHFKAHVMANLLNQVYLVKFYLHSMDNKFQVMQVRSKFTTHKTLLISSLGEVNSFALRKFRDLQGLYLSYFFFEVKENTERDINESIVAS